MNTTMRQLSLVTALSVAGLLTACGGGGTTASTGTGTLGVAMTDAPACGFDDVSVTVTKVRAHQSSTATDTDAGWSDITLSPARKINLLGLTNGVLENLGEAALTAGHYTQLRLVLAPNSGSTIANSVTPSGTTTAIALDTPSAATSGIKLVNEFDVAAGTRTDLVLDFDACKSIITKGGSGSYALRPVIKVIPTVVNGIDGFVDPLLANSHVMVTAQQNGNVISGTVPNPVTGAFSLLRLPAGNYDVVLTADARATTVIGTVPVASATSRIALNTSAQPVLMALASAPAASISGSVTMTPVSATETAFVAAKQSFAAGPVVTVKYQGVDVSNNTYALTGLPVVAPQYAPFSVGLPLVFSSVATSTPGTGKYSVTASATGYTSKTNLSVDVTLVSQSAINFNLIP